MADWSVARDSDIRRGKSAIVIWHKSAARRVELPPFGQGLRGGKLVSGVVTVGVGRVPVLATVHRTLALSECCIREPELVRR